MPELPESGTCIFENIKSEFVPFLKILDLPDFLFLKNSQIKNCYDLNGIRFFQEFVLLPIVWDTEQRIRNEERERQKKETKTYLVRCQSLTDGSMSFPKASRICNNP